MNKATLNCTRPLSIPLRPGKTLILRRETVATGHVSEDVGQQRARGQGGEQTLHLGSATGDIENLFRTAAAKVLLS